MSEQTLANNVAKDSINVSRHAGAVRCCGVGVTKVKCRPGGETNFANVINNKVNKLSAAWQLAYVAAAGVEHCPRTATPLNLRIWQSKCVVVVVLVIVHISIALTRKLTRN